MSCSRAQEFLGRQKVAVEEIVDAKKTRYSRSEVLALARKADRIVAAKGKKIITLEMKKEAPSEEQVLSLIVGPSGNLRAPTIRIGGILLVGFSEDAYKEYLTK